MVITMTKTTKKKTKAKTKATKTSKKTAKGADAEAKAKNKKQIARPARPSLIQQFAKRSPTTSPAEPDASARDPKLPARQVSAGQETGRPSAKPSIPPPVPQRPSRTSRPPAIPVRGSKPSIPGRASVPEIAPKDKSVPPKIRENTEEIDLTMELIEDTDLSEALAEDADLSEDLVEEDISAELLEVDEDDDSPTETFNPSHLGPPSRSKKAPKPPPKTPVTKGAQKVEASFFGETISSEVLEEIELPDLELSETQLTSPTLSRLTLSSMPPAPISPSEIVKKIMTSKKEPTVIHSFDGDIVPEAKALIEVCVSELSLAPDKVRASRLNFEMAQAYELMLEDEARALKHYQRSHDLLPEFIPAIRGARRIQLRQQGYAAVVKLYDAEIAATGSPKNKAALNLLKGRIFEDQLRQQSKARQCYARAMDLDPGNPAIIEAMKQLEVRAKNWASVSALLEQAASAAVTDTAHRAALMAQRARINDTRLKDAKTAIEVYQNALALDPVGSGASPALRPLLYTQSRWHDLIALLEDEIQRVSDPAVRTTTYIQISRIYSERLGDLDQAVVALERAIEISPGNALALEELAEHHAVRGDPAARMSALTRLVPSLNSAAEKLGVMHRLGQISEKELRDPDAAIRWYEEALALDPAYLPSVNALGELYAENERWEDLIRMYAAEAEAADDTKRRANAHARIAELFEHRLRQPMEAIAHHTRALSLLPGLDTSFKSLTRLLSQKKLYKELIELYEQAASQTAETELEIAYLFKIGALFEDALEQPVLAIASYNRILAKAPNHLGAILAKQRAAEAGNQLNELIDGLKAEAALIKGKPREVHLLQRIGEVYDAKIQDKESALVWYKKVLDLKADHVPALEAVGRIYHLIGRFEPLLEVYGRELRTLSRDDAKVALLTRMGDIAAHQLGDAPRAIAYYKRAIGIDPTFAPALYGLYQRLRETGDFAGLVEIMERELDGREDPEDKARVAVRLAEIHEINRGNPAQALKAYGLALKSLPDFRPGLDGAVRTAAQLEKWSELSEQLLAMAASARDEVETVGALLKAGEILNDYLGDTGRAITAFQGILEHQPANMNALISLAELLREKDDGVLAEVYSRLSQVSKDNGTKIMALFELGRLVSGKEIEGTDIRTVLEAILAIESTDLPTLTALEDIAIAGKDQSLLSQVDGHLVQALDDPGARAAYLARLAGTMEPVDTERSITACRSALSTDADNLSAIRCLRRLAQRTGNAELLTEALKRESQWIQNGEAAADLLVQCAAILRKLDDQKGAAEHLIAALDRYPEHTEAVSQLSELLSKDVNVLIEVLSRAANATRNNDIKAEYWGMVARLQADTMNNIPGGISALNRMLKEKPNHVPTMLQLADLYKRDRQWEKAVRTLEKVIKQAPPRKQLSQVQMDLACIAAEHLESPSRATKYVEELLKVDPKNSEGLIMLCDMQFRAGNLEAAGQTADRLLKVSDTDEERALALFGVGRVKLKRGSRNAAATALYEAVSLAGPMSPAAQEYKSMLGAREPWEKYRSALQEYQQRIRKDSPEAIENMAATVCELAQVAHEGMKNTNEAIHLLTQGLDALGEHPLLRLNLGLRLLDSKAYDEAIAEFRRLLLADPTHANGWRAMSYALKAKGKPQEAGYALAPLEVLGEANAKERAQLDRFEVTPGRAKAGAFDPKSLAQLSPGVPGEREAGELLTALNTTLTKVYPPELSRYGLSSRDRIGEGSRHPLRRIVDTLGEAFGTQELDLYIDRTGNNAFAVELTSPVGVIVPGYIMNIPQAAQVFILGRALTYITRGQQAALKLDEKGLALALDGVVHKYHPGRASRRFDTATLERVGKQIYKATAWRSRKNVEEVTLRYAAAKGNIEDIIQSMDTTATRAAAILACDLPPVVEEMARAGSLPPMDGKDLVIRSPKIMDLLSFWLSETAFRQRYKAGLL